LERTAGLAPKKNPTIMMRFLYLVSFILYD
jgi:hypothetical protein